MSLGLFDVVGPVMHGPSSSHTAGANRIGYLAGKIMGGIPANLEFGFHPIYYDIYAGHRTHAALAAGCLGYREDDDLSVHALEEALQRGITVDCYPIHGEEPHRNTMRVHGLLDHIHWEINGVSVGGGNIIINRINGVEVSLDGNNWGLLLRFSKRESMEKTGKWLAEWAGKDLKAVCHGKESNGEWIYCGAFRNEPPTEIPEECQPDLLTRRIIKPLYLFRLNTNKKPVFSTFENLLAAAESKPLIDVVLQYESSRSGLPAKAVLAEAERLVKVSREAMEKGFQEPIQLIGGLCSGREGKQMWNYALSGRTLMGAPFNKALARSVVMAEMNGAMGLVVAAPTGGAAGTLPGVLFTVAEQIKADDQQLAEAFLVSAAMGVVIGNRASFSGAVGGCQSEIGIAAAMAAGGAAWLASGSAEAVVHAAALALKNILGLTCDPPASPVEVPCIKRNGMGTAVAFMGAEMALAGLRSTVTPDDVVVALADTQRRLPSELKGSCGGLASTASGERMRQAWCEKLKTMQ